MKETNCNTKQFFSFVYKYKIYEVCVLFRVIMVTLGLPSKSPSQNLMPITDIPLEGLGSNVSSFYQLENFQGNLVDMVTPFFYPSMKKSVHLQQALVMMT